MDNEVTLEKPEVMLISTDPAWVTEQVGRLIITAPVFEEASVTQFPISVTVQEAAVPVFPPQEQAAQE
jgi:hypothetical protein